MKYSQISAVNTDTLTRGMNQSLSYSSSCISEAFFDAREYASDGGQYSSDDSGSGSDDDGDLTSDDETVSVEPRTGPARVIFRHRAMNSQFAAIDLSQLRMLSFPSRPSRVLTDVPAFDIGRPPRQPSRTALAA